MRRRGYTLFSIAFFLCACALNALLIWSDVRRAPEVPLYVTVLTAAGALLAAAALRFDVILHETGHLLFGLCAGLKVRRVLLGWFSFGEGGMRFGCRKVAGETQLALRKERGARARLIAAAAGGPLLGIAFLLLMTHLHHEISYHPALSLFTQLSVWCLPLTLSELLPAQLPAGATDGLVIDELLKKRGETEIALRVMQAQCLMRTQPVEQIDRALLFDVPVVREDSSAFLELMKLQHAYLLAQGDDGGAARILERINGVLAEREA